MNEAVLKFKSAGCLAIADRFLLEMSLYVRMMNIDDDIVVEYRDTRSVYDVCISFEHFANVSTMLSRLFKVRIVSSLCLYHIYLAINRAAQVVATNKRLRQLLSLVLAIG